MSADTPITSASPFWSNRWLAIARIAWCIVVALIVLLFLIGLWLSPGQLREICVEDTECHSAQLDRVGADYNHQLGLSLEFYAWYTTIVYIVFGGVFITVAVVIFWRRSNDWMALLISLFLVLLGTGANPVIPVPALSAVILLTAAGGFVPVIALFPDGKFVPGWMRWVIWASIAYAVITSIANPPPARGISSGPPGPITQIFFLTSVGSQVYRYWRVSTPLQRQQTKWVVLGIGGWFGCLMALLVVLALFPELSQPGLPEFFMDRYAFAIVGLLPILFFPLGLGFAILRYRLFDIDLIIRRTVLWAIISGLGLAVYLLAVGATSFFLGSQPDYVIPLVALILVAFIARPLYRRLEQVLDRVLPLKSSIPITDDE